MRPVPAVAAPVSPPPFPAISCHFPTCMIYSTSREVAVNTIFVFVILFSGVTCLFVIHTAICWLSSILFPQPVPVEIREVEIPEVETVLFEEGIRLAGNSTECAICLSKFQVRKRIWVGSCRHGFTSGVLKNGCLSASPVRFAGLVRIDKSDGGDICEQLPALIAINLSNNSLTHDIVVPQPLKIICILF